MKIKIRNKFIVNDMCTCIGRIKAIFFDDRIVKRIIKTIEFKMQEIKALMKLVITYSLLPNTR